MLLKRDSHRIQTICGHQLFDGSGVPTVLATVQLTGGIVASAAVPSGRCGGPFDACALRDHEKAYHGNGVSKAVHSINTLISQALAGCFCEEQSLIDHKMIALDGTENKSKLGGNAMLAVSLACARAAATAHEMALFSYLGGNNANLLPVPMLTLLEQSGRYAKNQRESGAFLILPVGAKNVSEAMRMGSDVFFTLGKLLQEKAGTVGIGEQGGWLLPLADDEQGLAWMMQAIEQAGYRPQTDIKLAMDLGWRRWHSASEPPSREAEQSTMFEARRHYLSSLTQKYPICSLEDPCAAEDFSGFAGLTQTLGEQVQVVGNDLFAASKTRLQQGIEQQSGNAICLHPGQIGTLSEMFDTVLLAKANGYRVVLATRSGETEDAALADLAVAVGAGQIKAGGLCRSEGVSKYNRLLSIESMLSHPKYGILGHA